MNRFIRVSIFIYVVILHGGIVINNYIFGKMILTDTAIGDAFFDKRSAWKVPPVDYRRFCSEGRIKNVALRCIMNMSTIAKFTGERKNWLARKNFFLKIEKSISRVLYFSQYGLKKISLALVYEK